MLFVVIQSFAQVNIYATTKYDMILSFVQLDAYDSNKGQLARFSPWFNLQENANFDVSNILGFTAGASIKNIGFIYRISDPSTIDNTFATTSIKKKFRTYNFGIPVGIKFGNLKSFYFMGGYELEFPLTYKEKTFKGNNKIKYDNEWFSNKTPSISHSLYFGIQFPYHFGVNFKYYLTEFFDGNCKDLVHDIPTIEYKDLHAHVFYVSLTYDIFRNTHTYLDNRFKKEDGETYYY